MTLLVNTAVIGNYTLPNTGVNVPGIFTPGIYNGQNVSLLKYFTGNLNTTNVNGQPGMVNFLDDGGAAPLLLNKPANGTSSNQYFLLTHLYELFGKLLGCSMFPAYAGDTSMYETHKYMKLSNNQIGYFIQQVGLSAKSFGVTDADVNSIATSLTNIFNTRCDAPVSIAGGPVGLQSICNGNDCPLAANNTCASYETVANSSSKKESWWIILTIYAFL